MVMTTNPFDPRGDRPQWQLVLDILERKDIDDLITYDELNEALDVEDFRKNRSPIYKAAAVWGEVHKRALAPVVNKGYRVVDAPEHELLARAQHRKSKRALKRGRTLLTNADRTRLTPEDRVRFDHMEETLGRHADMIRRLEGRQNRTEKALREARAATAETEAKVSAIEEALKRHGIGESD